MGIDQTRKTAEIIPFPLKRSTSARRKPDWATLEAAARNTHPCFGSWYHQDAIDVENSGTSRKN